MCRIFLDVRETRPTKLKINGRNQSRRGREQEEGEEEEEEEAEEEEEEEEVIPKPSALSS